MALTTGDTLLNGHYRIIRQLGRGGFGFVYQAQDTLLGEDVAIKELIPALVGDETMLKRFLAEAKATMRLSHDRIVRTHSIFSEGGDYYIAMEYIPSGSLEKRLREQGPLPVDEAVRIAAEICEGLSYAHNRGVVHCDLKPANILFTANGSAKVADFGIAHVSGEVSTRTWQTPAGFVAGTLPYMSPEQADGMRDDPRIDIYAVGAMLYRMLTDKTYLEFDQRETPGATADNVSRVRHEQPKSPSAHNRHIPSWLDAVVLKALAKPLEHRYKTAEVLSYALLRSNGAKESIPLPTTQPKTLAISVRSRQHRALLPAWFWPAAGGVAALLALILFALLLFNDRGKEDSATSTVQATEIAQQPATSTLTATTALKPEPTREQVSPSTPILESTRAHVLAPTATLVSTNTPKPAQPNTPESTDTPRPTNTPTASRTSTHTPRPTERPTSRVQPTSVPLATPSHWFWKRQGPFRAENGILGFVNYSDRKVTIRVDNATFEMPADWGAILAVEVPPSQYRARMWADQDQLPATGGFCETSNMEVQAGRALVMAVQYEWRRGYYAYPCWYEERDP